MKLRSHTKKIISIISYCVLALIILFISFRDPVLHWAIDKASEKIKDRTGATVSIQYSSFNGFSGISLHDISVVPLAGDTLIIADTVYIHLSFWTLLKGVVRINEISASGIRAVISCKDSVCNYSGFVHERQSSNLNESINKIKPFNETNYSLLLKRLLDRAFNFAPQRSNLKNIELIYRNDTLERSLVVNEFRSDEDSLTGLFEDKHNSAVWKCDGLFSQRKHLLELNVYPADSIRQILPLLNELTGLATGFDTLHLKLEGYKWSANNLTTGGSFSIKNLSFFHKKISNDTVKISSASFDFSFQAGKNYFEIDSNSYASLADIRFKPYIRVVSDTSREYTLNITTDKTPSTLFFNSLPKGMFDEVRDITADGTLQFILDFKINSACPDSLIFNTSFKKEKFRLRNLGSSDLLKMDGEFLHTVYERDRVVRVFMVGPSNPAYTNLDRISPNFINSVLTSEDGNFFFHNGFNEDAFRKSIAANFKAGKFVRGGSTITMQLVKNIFLTRKKTVARKAEEALLVWLIESNNLYTKERMLEVYMNIIELGPDIYGIGEASSFYFGKSPQDLTLAEGIFLASLLPHPKWFKYSFDTMGNLKPYLADYYRVVSNFMLRKELITQEEHDQLQPIVVLTGPARNLVIPSDTIPVEENEFADPLIDR